MQDEVEKLYIKEGKSRAIIKAIEDKLKPNHGSSMTFLSDPYGLCMHWNQTDGGHATLNIITGVKKGIRVEFTDNLVKDFKANPKHNDAVQFNLGKAIVILFHKPAIHLLYGSYDPNEPDTEAYLIYLVENLLHANWPGVAQTP